MGMLAAVTSADANLQSLRTSEKFHDLFQSAKEKIVEHDIQSINLRRQRRVPRRHFERSEDYIQTSAEDEYRMHFFKVIDTACALLKDNFISTDLREYQATTDLLFEQELEQNTISKYPELSASLKEELYFFPQAVP
jgi:hypothetical protein